MLFYKHIQTFFILCFILRCNQIYTVVHLPQFRFFNFTRSIAGYFCKDNLFRSFVPWKFFAESLYLLLGALLAWIQFYDSGRNLSQSFICHADNRNVFNLRSVYRSPNLYLGASTHTY